MPRFFSSWVWLLALFSIASFIETIFWGQMGAFTPLYLPKLGVAPEQVPTWTGAIAALSGAIGIPFLPLRGALAVAELYTGNDPGTAIGIVLGAGGLVTLILSPIIGSLADRFGHWRVLIVGAAATVLLWPLPALASNLVLFAVAWAVLNGVMAGVFAISFSVLSDSAATDVRGRVMSFAYLPVNVGSMIGPAIGSVVTQISVFAVFPAAAVMTILGVGMLAVARRR